MNLFTDLNCTIWLENNHMNYVAQRELCEADQIVYNSSRITIVRKIVNYCQMQEDLS